MRQGGGARDQYGGPSGPRRVRRGQPAPPLRLGGRLGLLLRPEVSLRSPWTPSPGSSPPPGARDPPFGLAPRDLTAPSPSSGFNGGSCSLDPALASSWPSGPFGPPLHSGDWTVAVILTCRRQVPPESPAAGAEARAPQQVEEGMPLTPRKTGPVASMGLWPKKEVGLGRARDFVVLQPFPKTLFHGPLFNPYNNPITWKCYYHTPASQTTNLQFED